MTLLPTVDIEEMPQTVEAFVALQEQVGSTPQGGAAMMVVALLLYAQDAPLGRQCLASAVDRKRLEEGREGYEGWRLRRRDMQLIDRQIKAQPYLAHAYIGGATPENGYRLPEPPYHVATSANPYSGDVASGTYKVFVECSGAASPRPVTVQQDERGIWRAREWSSLLLGIERPEA